MSWAAYSIRSLSSVFLLVVFLHGKQSQANEAIVFKVLYKSVLDVRYKGKFGQFCGSGNNFDTQIAGAVCQQMGMKLKESTDIGSSNVPPTQITVYKVKCTTTTLDSCNFTAPQGSDTCPIQTNVGTQTSSAITLSCHAITNVHLISTESDPHSGVVEVVRVAERGVVCYNSSKSANVANVICKQMGYIGGTATDTSKPAGYVGTSLDISCTSGSEANLDECLYIVNAVASGSNTFLHVQCTLTNASQITFDVRLSQSSKAIAGATSGTVEVFQYGKWGVICDTGWDIKDANVVCRQLGFKEALGFPTDAKFGQGTGIVFWNNIQCSGNEPSIQECNHDEALLGTGACNSVNASGVICSTEKFESKDICEDAAVSLELGITFIRSPGFPETFEYNLSSNNICSRNFTSPTPTNFTVYIQQKMFQNNHNEFLSFKTSAGHVETLYGDNSTQGPLTFDTKSLTIEFQTNGVAGKGKFRIMVTVPKPPPPPPTPSSQAVSDASLTTGMPTMPTPNFKKEEPEAVNVGGIVGGTLGGVGLIAIIVILVFVLCKNKKKFSIKRKHRKNSVGSSDKSLDELEQGGDVNPNFIKDETMVVKENDLYGRTGNTPQGVTPGNTDVSAEVPPKWKRKESKEPETGETKRNDSIGRPASGSDVKVDFANQPYNAYELEGPPQLNDNTYELEQQLKKTKGVESGPPGRSAPVDNVDSQQYAEVNKPWRVPKGQAPAAPRAKPHGTFTENANQDIDNGNVDDGSDVVPPVVYAEVNKPTSFIPGLSTSYADVEIGGYGAPSIQPEVPPKQETPETETKKGKKKKKKKKNEKEEDKKKDKKGKDKKKKKKKGFGSSDDVSDGRPKGDSFAVPMDNSNPIIYSEVGQTSVGQSGPVGDSQQVESDETYDVLQRKGPKQRPAAHVGVTDQMYESVNYKV